MVTNALELFRKKIRTGSNTLPVKVKRQSFLSYAYINYPQKYRNKRVKKF